MDATEQVRELYEAYQARDWSRAASYLHPDAVVEMPGTGERLVGRDGIIGFQRGYPEPWGDLTVGKVLGGRHECAAQVEVVHPEGQRFMMAAFWNQSAGLLAEGTEYWVTVGGDMPPPGRPTAFARDQRSGA